MSENAVDYMSILRAHDHPGAHGWEFPDDFDYDSAHQRFLDLAQAFQDLLGPHCVIESGVSIQDASFLEQILLPVEDFNRRHPEYATLRVSNWDSMATVANDAALGPKLLKQVQDVLQQFDYIYIPASVLEAPYYTDAEGNAGEDSWWIRYFDWV